MDLSQLQELVRRLIENEIEYPAFRAEFVHQFLCARHADMALEDLVNEIEGICADRDEGYIFESKLRDELSVIPDAYVGSSSVVEHLAVN